MSKSGYANAKTSAAARRIVQQLTSQFETKRYRTHAAVTSVQRDGVGRVVGATASVDGVENVPIIVDFGAPLAPGDVLLVENQGTATATAWAMVRRLVSTLSLPPIGQAATLPTPTGLDVDAWILLVGEGPVAFLYGMCNSVDDAYGLLHYHYQVQVNDPLASPDDIIILDTMETGTLQVAVDADDTVFAHSETEPTFSRAGRFKIESEIVAYTGFTWGAGDSGTGTGSAGKLTDGTKAWTADQWVGFALTVGGVTYEISSNSATELFVTGTPASGAYTVKPAFTGCTRAQGGTTAASHAVSKTIIRRTVGCLLGQHPANTDYNIRVRTERPADGAISTWTAWFSITTPVDTTAPPAPAGLTATAAPGQAILGWTSPTQDTVPDLSGFVVYQGFESDGSDATAIKTIGPVLNTGITAVPGVTYYYNLKAYDVFGNLSDFGDTWVPCAAQIGSMVQLLVNSDFERDRDEDDQPDEWWIDDLYGAVYEYGPYGINGGMAPRFTLAAFTGNPGDMVLGLQIKNLDYDLLPIIPVQVGRRYTATLYIKSSVAQQYWDLTLTGMPQTNCVRIQVQVAVGHDHGAAGILSDVPTQIIEELDDGWYRLMVTRVLTADDIDCFGGTLATYMGFVFTIQNYHTNQVQIRVDRAQLEIDGPSDYTPNMVPPGGSSPLGLLIDTSGIKTADGTVWLAGDGMWYSNLIPSGNGVRNLGASDHHWGVVYADSLVGSAAHDPVSLSSDADALFSLTAQALSLDTQAPNTIFGGPATGPTWADPTFRLLAVADLPSGYDHANLSNVSANQHHAQSHSLTGADHTATGLTTGHVVRASGATTFAWAQLSHSDLGSVTSDQHHAKVHSVTGTDHTISASQYQLVGATGTDTLGLLTPSSDVTGAAILRSDANGMLGLEGLGVKCAAPAAGGIDVNAAVTATALRAYDGNGLPITDDGSNLGLSVLDGGQVAVGTATAFGTSKLHVWGSLSLAASAAAASVIQFRFSGDTTGVIHSLGKSRGTAGTPATIADGDTIGQVTFQGQVGTTPGGTWYDGASISAVVTGSPSASDMPSRLDMATSADGSATPTVRLRILPTGYIGVGDSLTPSSRLEVQEGGGGEQLRLSFDATDRATFQVDTSGYLMVKPSGDRIGLGLTQDVAPRAGLEVFRAGEQLRLTYAEALGPNYAAFSVGNTGTLDITTVSNVILNPGGHNVNPGGHAEDDLGAYNTMWRTIFASELYVETLVAQEVMATIGGRITVAPTSKLYSALSGTNMLVNGDMESWTGGDLDTWADLPTDGTITQESTLKYNGSYSLKLTAGTLRTTRVTQTITVVAGDTYTLWIWARNGTGGAPARYTIYDLSNSAVIASGSFTDSTSAWACNVLSFEAPALCTSVSIRLYCPNTNTAIAYFDYCYALYGCIETEHEIFDVNDYVLLKGTSDGSTAQTEVMQITKAYTGTGSPPYKYGVKRGVDETTPNAWVLGAGIINIGYTAGEGWIDLTSTETTLQHLGPTMAIYSRHAGTTWNSVYPVVALGNLDSFLGYGNVYGLAIGNNLLESAPTNVAFKGLTATSADGLKLYNVPLEVYEAGGLAFKVDPSVPSLALGVTMPTGYSTGNGFWAGKDSSTYKFRVGYGAVADGPSLRWDGADLYIQAGTYNYLKASGTDLWMYSGLIAATARFKLTGGASPSLLFGSNVSAAGTTAIAIFGNDQTYNSESMGAGDLLIGDNSSAKANIFWDNSAATFFVRNATTQLFKVVGTATPLLAFGSDVSAVATTAIAVFGAAQTYNSESMGAGDLLIGDNSSAKANIWWDNSAAGFYIRSATTQLFKVLATATPLLAFGSNVSAVATTAIAVFGAAQTYNSESMGAGDLLIGDNSSAKANIWWDNSAAGFYIRSATTQLFKVLATATPLLAFGSDASAVATTAIAVFGAAQTYNSESMGAGDMLIGDNSANKGNIWWDNSAATFFLRSGTTQIFKVVGTSAPLLAFGSNVSSAATTSLVVFGSTATYNSESLGTGDLLIGYNQASNANILWDKSEARLKFRSGTTTTVYIDTDGTVVAGGGSVKINASGLLGYAAGPTQTFNIGTDGSGWIGTSTTFAWDASGVVALKAEFLTDPWATPSLMDAPFLSNKNGGGYRHFCWYPVSVKIDDAFGVNSFSTTDLAYTTYLCTAYGGPYVDLNGTTSKAYTTSSLWPQPLANKWFFWCWVKADTLATNNRTIISNYDPGNSSCSYLLQWGVTSGAFEWIVNGVGTAINDKTVTSTYTESTGVWYFVACYFQPSTLIRIWVGRASDASLTVTSNTTSIPASMFETSRSTKHQIGAQNNSDTPRYFWDGQIGCMAAWFAVPETAINDYATLMWNKTKKFYQ